MIRRNFLRSLSGSSVWVAAQYAIPLTSLAMASPGHSKITDLNDAISKAGRQRMLSQRISKAYLAQVAQIPSQQIQRVLDQSVAALDRQVFELIAYAPTATLKDVYIKQSDVWGQMKLIVMGDVPSKNGATPLLTLSDQLLNLAELGVQQLSAMSKTDQGKLVALSGRQRMLSQYMARVYLAESLQIRGVANNHAQLEKARTEFVQALAVLKKAPQSHSNAQQELDLGEQQWVFFDNALRQPATRPQLMAEVFTASENILSVMDKLTKIYAEEKA